MNKSKIGIATVYTGYNYGSALQAYATKKILSSMGYDAELLKLSGSLLPGRDVRLRKLVTIVLRSLIHRDGAKNLKNYTESISKQLPKESTACFDKFISSELAPVSLSYSALKRTAHSDEYAAFVCGSDQVWNSAVFYVDPFYYLRFAPKDKRVAFAPSFGRDFVPDYNRKKIAKYIAEIPFKSVRESSGVKLIDELTGEKATVLLDPTLVLGAKEWTDWLGLDKPSDEKYLLAYFLDEPSEKAVKAVNEISQKFGLKIVALPYILDNSPWKNEIATAGPREFAEYVKNAEFVCTDSFHGTAFSLNFNVPFYTFERNYKNACKQSARIESILKLVSKSERYEPESIDGCMDISFDHANSVLDAEREKARDYLLNALNGGGKTNE